MGNETRRKNVMTEFSNVYSTYSTSEMFDKFRIANDKCTYSTSEMFDKTLTNGRKRLDQPHPTHVCDL